MKNPKRHFAVVRPRVPYYAMVASAALLCGLVAPAVAQETPPQSAEQSTEASPSAIDAVIEVTGWPDDEVLRAGEQFTVTMQVDSELVGAPTLEGNLVGLNYEDEPVALATLDEFGTAELTVRPLALGELEFVPFMAETESYDYATGDSHLVEVDEVPVSVDLGFDESYESPTAYGGGEQTVFVSVESDCEVMAQSDVEREECAATYGEPSGRLTLMRGSEVVEQVSVSGSWSDSKFADPGQSLSIGEAAESTFVFSVPVPNIRLGGDDSVNYSVLFEPFNWFDGGNAAADSQLRAAPTSIEVFVGDDLIDPQHVVYADEVTLMAFITGADGAAPIEGSVQFFANGEPISGQLEVEDEVGAGFEWKPAEGTGEYAITATFTPETLNLESSESEAYPLTVVVTPAPNPTPVDPDPSDTKTPEDRNSGGTETPAKRDGKLANTGSQGPVIAAIASMVLVGAGATALLLTRRRG